MEVQNDFKAPQLALHAQNTHDLSGKAHRSG